MSEFSDYELSYEFDGEDFGGLLAINLRGHRHHPDAIDRFLEDRRWDDDFDATGEWEVREAWLRKVPVRAGGSMHVYSTHPGPGARAVTVLERPTHWDYWCINHEFERASSGFPAAQVVDGEALVARRLSQLAEDADPRRDVSLRSGMGGYVYMCCECATDFSQRLWIARQEAGR